MFYLNLGARAAALLVLAILLFFSSSAGSATKLVSVDVELDGSDVTVTFTNNAGRFLMLEDGAFAYVKANRQLKIKPEFARFAGFRWDGPTWSKPLPTGPKRMMSFTLSNPPREPYCLKVAASGRGRMLSARIMGSACTS